MTANKSFTENPLNGNYTMDFLQNFLEREEATEDFKDIHKYCGELVNMNGHVSALCKNLDGTAFYASSISITQFNLF